MSVPHQHYLLRGFVASEELASSVVPFYPAEDITAVSAEHDARQSVPGAVNPFLSIGQDIGSSGNLRLHPQEYIFVNDRIREAKNQIVLIDNYVDDSVLKMLDKRDKGVVAKIYSKLLLPHINVDIAKHNAQYEPIEVELFDRAHDRFLCIDDTVYHIGASLKDLGKKWFAFSKMEMTTDELLKKI